MLSLLTSPLVQQAPSYRVDIAESKADLRAAQALRFTVFNTELNEGLASSYETGLDQDPFDAVCTHLLVRHVATRQVVGTYRMQTGALASKCLGYYCAQEFEFATFEPLRSQILELGRACIAREHRNFQVLSLLWRGIASYAQEHGARYLLGCSSLTSQDPALGMAAYRAMQGNLAPPAYRTVPLAGCACAPSDNVDSLRVQLPKLLSAYLSLGAWICGPPALDRTFKTIDFLTMLDLQSPDMHQRRRRFGILG